MDIQTPSPVPAPPREPFIHRHALTLAFAALSLLSLAGHAWAGWLAENEMLGLARLPPVGLRAYLASGTFASSLLAHWPRDLLQVGTFVLLRLWLRRRSPRRDERWLSYALPGLFGACMLAQLESSWRASVSAQLQRGVAPGGLLSHAVDAGFWFDAFHDWQGALLSVVALCLLSIALREDDAADGAA